jgi:hypothetical protein
MMDERGRERVKVAQDPYQNKQSRMKFGDGE